MTSLKVSVKFLYPKIERRLKRNRSDHWKYEDENPLLSYRIVAFTDIALNKRRSLAGDELGRGHVQRMTLYLGFARDSR